MIKQLKESSQYSKSGIVLFTPNRHKLHNDFQDLKPDYIFDHSTNIVELVQNTAQIILSRVETIIPESFNVLVLDDNLGILDIISSFLSELKHHNFDLCTSVDGAKKLLDQKDFDLLLLDWNLEDGTCIDVINYIKDSPLSIRTKNASTVVITGRDGVDDLMTLRDHGVNNSIIKPFDIKEFGDKILYAIDRKRQYLQERK